LPLRSAALIETDGLRRLLAGKLEKGVENPFSCCVLAGQRSTDERRRNLAAFKEGDIRFLVCTDVAARGLDIAELPYVINMTLPDKEEDYVHRVGRVGRADVMGLAISLVSTRHKEKVWYYDKRKWEGKALSTKLASEGGCCIWYDEPSLLKGVQTRLGTTIETLDAFLIRQPGGVSNLGPELPATERARPPEPAAM
jgi:ATP-dependent RNA helicase DDX1